MELTKSLTRGKGVKTSGRAGPQFAVSSFVSWGHRMKGMEMQLNKFTATRHDGSCVLN